MLAPTIRTARPDEVDEIGRVWMESWVSTGLDERSNFLLANLRARVRREIENGWSLYVADDGGQIAAMLSLHLPDRYLDQIFVAPEYQGRGLGRRLLGFAREHLPMRSGCAASARTTRPGAGMSARALCSKRKRLNR